MNNVKDLNKHISWMYFFPLIIAISFVPLIVYLKVIPVHETVIGFWKGEKQNPDFFSYYKSIWIVISAIISVVSLTACIIFKKIKLRKTFLYIPLGIYAAFTVISTVLSDYPHTAVFGFPDRYEGMLAILSYLTLYFAAINLIQNEKHVKLLLFALFISAVVIEIIGLFQYFNIDFFKSDMAKTLILPEEYQHLANKIQFRFEDSHLYNKTIYSTLYNPNNLGNYAAIIFPLSLTLFFFSKSVKQRVGLGFLCCLTFINLVGCGSRGAFIGIASAIIFLIIFLNKMLIEKLKLSLGIFAVLLSIFVSFNYFGGGEITKRLKTITDSSDSQFFASSLDKIKDFRIDNDGLTLITHSSTLKVKSQNKQLQFFDDSGNNIDLVKNETNKTYGLRSDDFKDLTISMNGNVVKFKKGNSFINFALKNDAFRLADSKGKLVEIASVQSIGFQNNQRFASSRGYIWSRTIPLIKNTLFLGYGPDTFSIYFPQNDYLGKLRAMYDAYLIIDKPHNMYLQTSITTGCISLLALLLLFIVCFIIGSRKLWNCRFDNFHAVSTLAISAGVIGYLVSGLATDSVVSVAPVFWILFGIGTATTLMLGNES